MVEDFLNAAPRIKLHFWPIILTLHEQIVTNSPEGSLLDLGSGGEGSFSFLHPSATSLMGKALLDKAAELNNQGVEV